MITHSIFIRSIRVAVLLGVLEVSAYSILHSGSSDHESSAVPTSKHDTASSVPTVGISEIKTERRVRFTLDVVDLPSSSSTSKMCRHKKEESNLTGKVRLTVSLPTREEIRQENREKYIQIEKTKGHLIAEQTKVQKAIQAAEYLMTLPEERNPTLQKKLERFKIKLKEVEGKIALDQQPPENPI